MSKHILLTGGAGYIGSHICVQLLAAGYAVTIIDNFTNSYPEVIQRIERVSGKSLTLIQADLACEKGYECARKELASVVVDGAIHLAGLKAVADSVAQPLHYYKNNILCTLNLIQLLEEKKAKRIVFSSSATVYGENVKSPVGEDALCMPTNPYGRTKYFIEDILKDLVVADKGWQVINLRYFNPVGAHVSGELGEDPQGVPANLFPYVAQVAAGLRDNIHVFGSDYPTVDGTGVRDYIHVEDLAAGHLAALAWLAGQASGVSRDINLGTGRGYSVLQVIKAFEAAAGCELPFILEARRPGDIAEVFAQACLAERLLGWQPRYDMARMCADHWRWQTQNPQGYRRN